MADRSILNNTKHILGLAAGYSPFDHDVLTHINSTFSILDQLGIGPEGGYFIESNEETWDDYVEASDLPANQLNLVRTYLYLKVRMLFDPPTTSYLIDSMNKQIAEHEHRLNTFREVIKQQEWNDAHPEVLVEEEV